MGGWVRSKEIVEAAEEAEAERRRREREWYASLTRCRCAEPVPDLRSYLGHRVCRCCGKLM